MQTEWLRFLQAQQTAVEQLGQLEARAEATAGPESAFLFETHQMMAQDDDYMETVRSGIAGGHLNAEAALYDATTRFVRQFSSAESNYMRARAADIRDVSRRILRILTGRLSEQFDPEVPSILVVDDLSPSEIIQLDREKVLGIVLQGGSPEAHASILARSMGIPLVVRASDLADPALEGQEAWVDGSTGRVVLNADEATRARLLRSRERERHSRHLLQALKGLPNVTLDGKSIRISCNIGLPEETTIVKKCDGDGVGLFRSDYLYLMGADWPTEEEQFYAYRTVLGALRGQTVTIRTLDIGAEQSVPYFSVPGQRNPALGLRSLRISLTRPEVLRAQLRALYRASVFGNLRILLPMVTSEWEVREAREACRRAMEELDVDGYPYDPKIPLGVMIETPAAVLISDRLAELADFISIGTNDLTQYLMASDPQSDRMDRFYEPCHPSLWRALRLTTRSAHKKGLPVCVCGEIAADPALAATFLALGVDELSVTPSAVLPLREKIRSLDLATLAPHILEEIG